MSRTMSRAERQISNLKRRRDEGQVLSGPDQRVLESFEQAQVSCDKVASDQVSASKRNEKDRDRRGGEIADGLISQKKRSKERAELKNESTARKAAIRKKYMSTPLSPVERQQLEALESQANSGVQVPIEVMRQLGDFRTRSELKEVVEVPVKSKKVK